MASAIGAKKYKVAGQYLQIAFFVATIIMIPVIFLWSITGPVLKYLGNEEDVSNAAWSYALILSVALPARIAFKNFTSYFTAMKIMQPQVRSSAVGISVNLLVGLPLVVGWPFSRSENGF